MKYLITLAAGNHNSRGERPAAPFTTFDTSGYVSFLYRVFRSADCRFCLRCAVLLSRNMTSIFLWTLRSPRRLLLKLRHRRFPLIIQAVHDSLVNMLHLPITFLHRLFNKKENKISLDRDRIWIARTTDQRVEHGVTRTHNIYYYYIWCD